MSETGSLSAGTVTNVPTNLFRLAGYDAVSDETFLDIRDPDELRLVGRARLGFRIPLGFHGCFVPGADRERLS